MRSISEIHLGIHWFINLLCLQVSFIVERPESSEAKCWAKDALKSATTRTSSTAPREKYKWAKMSAEQRAKVEQQQQLQQKQQQQQSAQNLCIHKVYFTLTPLLF
ncbi:unnamed protein product [Anisakis simplex]|uniref:Secreted protein n=1 Tax=Anisakis simplex TaxID=6269 RepID=A0A0M3JE73_ANISI|nr:unnamed protein product [Anisakis simplex]